MSLRDLILAASDLKREAVEVPEWGCTVYVGTMSGKQRVSWAEATWNDDGAVKPLSNATLLANTLFEEDGTRIFTDAEIPSLADKSGAVIFRLINIAKRLNGLGAEEVDKAEKN